MISKVFPAGFGWQFSSGVAEEIGFGADTAGFALTTGIGDAAGVFLGHTLYKAAQSLVSDKVVSGREGWCPADAPMHMSLQDLRMCRQKPHQKRTAPRPPVPAATFAPDNPPRGGAKNCHALVSDPCH